MLISCDEKRAVLYKRQAANIACQFTMNSLVSFILVSFTVVSQVVSTDDFPKVQNEARNRRDLGGLVNIDTYMNGIDKCFCGNSIWLEKLEGKNGIPFDKCFTPFVTKMEAIESDYLKNNPSTEEINNVKLKARREAYVCVADCIFKINDLILNDGSLNQIATKKYLLKNVFTEDWTKDIAEAVIDVCLENGKELYKKQNRALLCNSEGFYCNTEAFSFLTLCLPMEIEKVCPSSKKIIDSSCRSLHTNLNNETFMDYQYKMNC